MELGILILTITVVLGITGWLTFVTRLSDFSTKFATAKIKIAEEKLELENAKEYARLDSKIEKALENGKYMTEKSFKQKKKQRASEILRSTANSSTEA